MPGTVHVDQIPMSRRRLLQWSALAGAGLVVGTTSGCAGPAVTAAPQVPGALVTALTWLGGKLLDDGRAWLVGRGLDAVAERVDRGEASVSAYRYPTGADIAAVADARDDPATYWTIPRERDSLHNWLPRGWEAIGRAGEALSALIGVDAARAAVVPARPGTDHGGGRNSAKKQSTYWAADDGMVTVRFDGTGPAPVETVELARWRDEEDRPWQISFLVDPENPLFLK